jgi:dTDP-4-dehydrorhamnose 3,5-epimerase
MDIAYHAIRKGAGAMEFTVEKTPIRDVIIVKPEVFGDQRGFFSEIYRQDKFKALRLPEAFVQLNHSGSVKDVVRGVHFQWEPPMGKLMRVTCGKAFLVAVDIRKGSPTLGKWFGVEASSENRLQVWAPAGCARGFCVTSDYAEIQYLCTGIYNSKGESGIRWNDPAIGIEWPTKTPILSQKDQSAQTLAEWLQRNDSAFFSY